MRTSVHRFTPWEEIQLWWTVSGELNYWLATYYTICSIAGFMQGFWICSRLVGTM